MRGISHWKGCQALGQDAQGKGAATIPAMLKTQADVVQWGPGRLHTSMCLQNSQIQPSFG